MCETVAYATHRSVSSVRPSNSPSRLVMSPRLLLLRYLKDSECGRETTTFNARAGAQRRSTCGAQDHFGNRCRDGAATLTHNLRIMHNHSILVDLCYGRGGTFTSKYFNSSEPLGRPTTLFLCTPMCLWFAISRYPPPWNCFVTLFKTAWLSPILREVELLARASGFKMVVKMGIAPLPRHESA